MVDGNALRDGRGVGHHGLTEQRAQPSAQFADTIIAITADDEEIIVPRIPVTTEQAEAVLERPADHVHVRFDAHIAEVQPRRGPEIVIGGIHPDAETAAEVIHRAAGADRPRPAAGGIGKVVFEQRIAGLSQQVRDAVGLAGGSSQGKQEQREKPAKSVHSVHQFYQRVA